MLDLQLSRISGNDSQRTDLLLLHLGLPLNMQLHQRQLAILRYASFRLRRLRL